MQSQMGNADRCRGEQLCWTYYQPSARQLQLYMLVSIVDFGRGLTFHSAQQWHGCWHYQQTASLPMGQEEQRLTAAPALLQAKSTK